MLSYGQKIETDWAKIEMTAAIEKSVVSNTQVSSFGLCENQHHYRFGMGIEPKPDLLSPALYRGITGHNALEAYYAAIMEGDDVDTAKKAMKGVLQKEMLRVSVEMPEDVDRIALLAQLFQLLDGYVEHYRNEPFKVIAVEKVYQAPITASILYSMKLDLLIQWQSGPFRGDYEIFDHKFVYNFKDVAELEMDGQMPKYLRTLKANGITISKGRFNQIRYRPMKYATASDIFRRTPARLTPAKTENIWDEQRKWALKIQEADKDDHLRTLSVVACRGCYFYEICNAELMGQNTDKLISTRYQPTTYGYTDMGEQE